jgi:hypothetical protein
MAENKSSGKKRNWACVLYPESAPEGWREILQQTGLQCAISPLHDADVNADDTEKKAHWHVILCYSGPTAFEPVKRVTDSLNAPAPQPIEQVKGYYRYLTHMDNPEKTQYDPRGIEHINGFNIRDYADMTKSEITAIKRLIQRFIFEHDLEEYWDLMVCLDSEDVPNGGDMYEVAANNTIFCTAMLSSKRNKRMQAQK